MVPLRHALAQGPVIRALGGVALAALVPRRAAAGAARAAHEVPGPWVEAELPPRPDALVRDYIAHVGGDPAWYRGCLPPHLFPQWGFPLAVRALAALPYPYARAVNAGCRIDVRAPLPAGEPLQARARVEAVDDDGRRALVTVGVVTGTRSAPDAVTAAMRVYLPLGGRGGGRGQSKAPPSVPADAEEVARLSIDRRAGLAFAVLTGDFNPIHWVRIYARAAGFRSTILHGFATLARAIEALNGATLASDPMRLGAIDARFTKPLVLPARVSVYTSTARDHAASVWVGDERAAGRTPAAYLEGSFTVS